jgi:ADP-L-glycero-D-manno-heptose 6-epimerase
MIIITGAAGFIGSCVAAKFLAEGHQDLVLVDDFSRPDRQANYAQKNYLERVDRNLFFQWLKGKEKDIDLIIHLGARTDTTDPTWPIFQTLNLEYSQRIWKICSQHTIPLIYASSAATYGDGSQGFDDDPAKMEQYEPMNPYGKSKHLFDLWVRQQTEAPPFWYGLKFFNVYGPNEYHKGRMASVVLHAHRQILQTGQLKLFRSHRPDFADGEQMRDFIYVKDLNEVIFFLTNHGKDPGIYNLGTGVARYFNDLGKQVFVSMKRDPDIVYIDTPEDIRNTYQYFTEAKMNRLRTIGFTKEFTSLEEGINDYVANYLQNKKYY